jgi:hypothetical protein
MLWPCGGGTFHVEKRRERWENNIKNNLILGKIVAPTCIPLKMGLAVGMAGDKLTVDWCMQFQRHGCLASQRYF